VIPNAEHLKVGQVVIGSVPVDVVYIQHALVGVIPTHDAPFSVGPKGACPIARDPFPVAIYLEYPGIDLSGPR
jgi:hypothetical protein